MMVAEKFWMVKGRGPASYCHDSRASAEHEAKRLARENPGELFAVLEAVTGFKKPDVEEVQLEDPLPF